MSAGAINISPETALWLLQQEMSNLSEACYCAGWLTECEHTIWELIEGNGDQWGMCSFDKDEIVLSRIRELRDASGMWFCGYDNPCTVEEFRQIHQDGYSGGWRIR